MASLHVEQSRVEQVFIESLFFLMNTALWVIFFFSHVKLSPSFILVSTVKNTVF
jgi:hypothetical protein